MQPDKLSSEMKIRFDRVTHTYNAGMPFAKTALSDVSFAVPAGAFVALVGHTGSGKSTLIQHINALMKPTSGRVFIDGQDISGGNVDLKRVRQKAGLVFQYPEHQLFEETVLKDVCFGPLNLGLSLPEAQARAEKALAIVGIAEADYVKSPFELSGGQKRRAAIAGVLAMEPEILILDEPTAGLDPRGRDALMDNLLNMHKSLGLTVILVTHSMEDAARYAGQVLVMKDGAIVMNGTPGDVFTRLEELEDAGLSGPELSRLSHALREKGIRLNLDAFTPEDAANALFALLKGVTA